MKKIFIYLVIIVATSALYLSCSKNIEGRTDNLSFLSPVSLDIDAGTWKPVLLSRPDTFIVAAPAATTTPGYIADLNEIKGYQRNLSNDAINKIHYWVQAVF